MTAETKVGCRAFVGIANVDTNGNSIPNGTSWRKLEITKEIRNCANSGPAIIPQKRVPSTTIYFQSKEGCVRFAASTNPNCEWPFMLTIAISPGRFADSYAGIAIGDLDTLETSQI